MDTALNNESVFLCEICIQTTNREHALCCTHHPNKEPTMPAHQAFLPAGFFAFRTPLLPFDELFAWSEGLESPGAVNDPAHLETALAADRSRLRTGLQAILTRPEVRDAKIGRASCRERV